MDEEHQRRSAVTFAWVEAAILVPALLLYVLSLYAMVGLGEGDNLSNSLGSFFAGAVIFLLWLLVAAFVALSSRSRKALLAAGMAICLYGLMISIGTIGMERPGWATITPAALPPVALAYAVWARFAAEWPLRWRLLSMAAFVGLAVAAAMPFYIAEDRWMAAAPQREAERRKAEADYQRSEAETAARREAEYQALGPDSRLEDFFTWIPSDHEEAVMAMIRTLPSRQADAVRLLDDGGTELYEFRRMPEFGLAVTPELCASYRRRIEGKLAEFGPNDQGSNDNAVELATYIDNFRWLHGNGCNMADLAAREAALLRRHPNDHARSEAALFEAIR